MNENPYPKSDEEVAKVIEINERSRTRKNRLDLLKPAAKFVVAEIVAIAIIKKVAEYIDKP